MERSIRYLRGSFFEARRYRDLNDLNEQLRTWIAETADARIVPDDPEEATVREAFEHEQRLLLALPKHAFETRFVRAVKSGKTPYIRFDKNDYSIPQTLIQKPLTVAASEHEIRIRDGRDEVARHVRCWPCFCVPLAGKGIGRLSARCTSHRLLWRNKAHANA